MSDSGNKKEEKKVKSRKEQRFDREAKALQKNLEKRKKQQAEREKLKQMKGN